MANEGDNDEAVNDNPLASHSQANEDVGAPRKPTRLFRALLQLKAASLGILPAA